MKIGYVFSNLLMGGVQSFYSDLARTFNSKYEVKYTILDSKLADPILENRLSRIEKVSKQELLKWSDIINLDGIISNDDKQFFRPKWKSTIEYLGSARHYTLKERIFKQNLPPYIVASSKFVSSTLKVKSRVIYTGRDTNWFSPKPMEKKYDLAIIGRMRPVKNHKLFIEICKSGNFSFVTIGGTHRRLEGHVNDIEKMVRANARKAIDYVPGFVSDLDMLDLINQSRIGLVVSNSVGAPEGAEFMSCGIPTIVRKIGGSAELHDEYNELVMPYDSPASAYVDCINKYINDIHIGAKMRQTILSEFSKEKSIQAFDQLYFEIKEKVKY